MNLEIIVSRLYLMTSPSERGPKKMQRENISFWKCLLRLSLLSFIATGCGTVLPSLFMNCTARCFPCIPWDAQLSSPPLPAVVPLHWQAAMSQDLLSCLCICPTQQAHPSCCPTGQVQSLYKPHIRQVLEKTKESFCIFSFEFQIPFETVRPCRDSYL